MLLRIVALFLIFMLVMGAVHKLLRGRAEPRRRAIDRLRCPLCKRIQLVHSAGPCGRIDCGSR